MATASQAKTEITVEIKPLRQAWQVAVKDDGPGVPAEEVLDRLERKYEAMAEAAGPAK
jgi:antitoxin ParD1/3/4